MQVQFDKITHKNADKFTDYSKFAHLKTNPDYLYNVGTGLVQKGGILNAEKAIKTFKAALKLKATRESYLNLGAAYKELLQYDKALECFQASADIDPNYTFALNNLGLVYHILGSDDYEAEKYYERAIAIDPEYADAHWNLAVSKLRRCHDGCNSEWKDAWEESLWRFRKTSPVAISRIPPGAELWEGQPDGKLLIMYEQGIGDSIQFSRFFPYIKNDFTIQAPGGLHNLYSGYNYSNSSEGDYKYFVPICQLAQYFNAIPYGQYITHEEKTEFPKDKLNIGIVWKGNKHHANDRNRSLNIRDFYKLFDSRVNLWSLQKGEDSCRDIKKLKIRDWNDTMAHINGLDLIISVDTSIIHLAAAMGKETWVLIPKYDVDWRWGIKAEKNLWYPSLKLFRNLDMNAVVKALQEKLNGTIV